MSIRTKLFSLILALIVTFVISVAVYFIVLSPVASIETERQKLDNLRTAFAAEASELNRLARAPFDRQLESFKASVANTQKAFDEVHRMKVLPAINDSVGKALVVIENLQGLLGGDTSDFSAAVDAMLAVARQLYPAGVSFDVPALLTDRRVQAQGPSSRMVVSAQRFFTEMEILDETIKSSESVVSSQFSIIDREVAKIESRSRVTAAVIIVVITAITFVVFLTIMRRIANSIRFIEAGIAEMKEGDLTARFQAATRDEIGVLSSNLNQFTDELKQTIAHVQQVSHDNIQLKQNLIVTTEQTGSSATQINVNVESIGREIAGLDEKFVAAGRDVDQILNNIAALNQQIEEQMSMVEESTASVTEMIATLQNVATITERRRSAADRLLEIMENGGRKAAATSEVVQKINDNVGNIHTITGLMDGISSQTNLLAMNAAIEAAHAGDAGRGFSVVADEIRKLSEASAQQSKEIDKILREMVGLISEASASGAELNEAFSAIEREVKEFSSSLSEIASTMEEIRSGGSQVLQAMVVLQGASEAVQRGSGTIKESSASIHDAMVAVQRVSSEVRGGMGEIAAGIREITSAVAGVLEIAERLGSSSDSLDRALLRFKTAPDDSSAESGEPAPSEESRS